jgi:hypothetical protein
MGEGKACFLPIPEFPLDRLARREGGTASISLSIQSRTPAPWPGDVSLTHDRSSEVIDELSAAPSGSSAGTGLHPRPFTSFGGVLRERHRR